MYCFSIKKVFSVKNMEEIEYDFVSKIEYRWEYENQIHIINDQKTIIGVEYNKKNYHSVLILEDIRNKDINYSPIKFGDHNSEITTILVDKEEKYILSGGSDYKVIQYTLNKNKDSINVLKYYGDINIYYIRSSIRIDNIAIFGGTDHKLRVILLDKQEIWKKPIKVRVKFINSLEICRVTSSDPKRLLVLSGKNPNNSQLKSKIFDITNSCLLYTSPSPRD